MLYTFDCYGTIINWLEGARKKFLELYPGREDIVDEFISLWGEKDWELVNSGVYRPYREYLEEGFKYALEQLNLEYDKEIIDNLVYSIYEWMPFQDAPPVLKRLRELGVKLGIISNTDRDFIIKSIENIGVKIDYIIVAEDIKIYKPDTKVFIEARKIIPSKYHDKWFHVSSYPGYDINPASKAGLKTIFLDRYRLGNELSTEPSYIIYRIEDLIKIYEKEK